jgi:hypothetical protein
MPYQGSLSSYDAGVGPTRADLGKHGSAGRVWLGFGPERCMGSARWGEFGCAERVLALIACLQVSTERDRAGDFRHHPHLFTMVEASAIAANDQCSPAQRIAALAPGRWSPPHPAVPGLAPVLRRSLPYSVGG